MLFENYRENVVYSSQTRINFPKSSVGNKPGEGVALFLMCPNRNKAVEAIMDPVMNLVQSQYKRIVTDAVYKEKIGTNRIFSLERAQTDRYYIQIKDFPLYYINYSSRNSILSKKKNVVNDLSRWMEIIFDRVDQVGAKIKCKEFLRILKDRLRDPLYKSYEKILIFDLNSWSSTVKSCVIMNRELLNNPLSIFLYAANYYPELLSDFPKTKFMIINRGSGQLYITNTSYFRKENYSKIRAKLSVFKSLVFSTSEEFDPTDEQLQKEVNAQIINSFKMELKKKLRYNLLGKDSNSNIFDDIDITTSTSEPFDDELQKLENEINDIENSNTENEENNETVNIETGEDFDVNEEINRAVDEELDYITDLTNLEDVDIEEVTQNITDKINNKRYKTSFMPERTPEEIARIERLTNDQKQFLTKRKSNTERKTIKTSITGGNIKTSNPNILSSKFVNFDKDYVDKALEADIDDAVSILSKASRKLFITNKIVEDSSNTQSLKSTYTYKLEDEKGNKYQLSFDIPKIIDGNYVYLNGTKKNIRHQFILKPIVKTSPDVVQIVTFYNKVFIYRRGLVNQNINRIITYLEKNPQEYKIRVGNSSMKNQEYDVPLDLSMFARYFSEFTVHGYTFYGSIDSLLENYKKVMKKDLNFDKNVELPIAFNKKTKDVKMLNLTSDSYENTIYNLFSESERESIKKIKRKPKLVTANVKMLRKEIPLILFMLFCEGFTSVMKKANIEYEFVKKDEKKKLDPMLWDSIELSDGFIAWKKSPFRNELLLNGLKREDMTLYSFEDLDSKDTYISLLAMKYPGNQKIDIALDNYKDFLLDDKTKDILEDFGYPTDLVSLLVVACGMLTDTHYLIENNMNNMRIRSNEVIAELVYSAVTKAYTDYRKTSYKKRPSSLQIKKSQIIDNLLSSDTNMIEEFSSLNPILELEKQRAVTFKGIRGIQKDRAMTLPRRAYDKSMLGTIGISTSPDANVGVVRQLTMEPQITSTNGYIDTSKSLDELNSANLFTVAEMISPLGVIHDDPDRTAMSYKQTKYMVPIRDADPVLIGNKVESTIPYLLSDEFIVTADEDGEVVEKTKDYIVIKYKSGINKAIDITNRVRKNSSSGTWMNNSLVSKLEKGDKFKSGDVLAYNDKHFSLNREDRGASMNLGALCKIAISSQWDVFEDSAPISKRLSTKLTSEMVEEKHVTFSPYTYVDYIVNVGDKIKAGDPLIIFSDAMTDTMQNLFDSMRQEHKEAVIESAKTSVLSKYTGEIVDIKIYTTSELEDLDPSLQKIVKGYWNRIEKRNKLLDKYKNEGDLNYYKASQPITEVASVVHPNKSGKLNGYYVDEGNVLFLFYIKYEVAASKGDKVVVSVCKGIVSHVFKEGMEPYSEYRPDEVIDTIVAPLAVAARKVPAIFLTIFGNKLLIELKRQIKEMYEK